MSCESQEFPFAIEPVRRCLLAPLRSQIVLLEFLARERLAQIRAIYGCEIGMLQDSIEFALDHCPALIGVCADDCRRNARECASDNGRLGYDTWPRSTRTHYIATAELLARTLDALDAALTRLREAEIEALQEWSA